MTLPDTDVQLVGRRTAMRLPGVSHGYPLTEFLDVYKVADKVFLIVTDDPANLIVTVKVPPERGRALQRNHETITPGRYFDKRHWVSVGAGPGITEDLVESLVIDSYDAVVENVPLRKRPKYPAKSINSHFQR
jgi:predicted DNA-binding protein (MmcQ/YjbR family)